jgi:UDP-GlcNAc3NAcA epimerase
MHKILTIVGARPQIIKAAAISREINNHFSQEIEELIIHTGQHYDENMSSVFFDELEIPKPFANLNVGSGSHASQTAEIMNGIEKLIISMQANAVLIYGDTNSTLAAALASSKVHIPVIHIEAGLRSYNKQMPEEINRIMSDHVSTLLFCPTIQAIENLRKEGFSTNINQKASIDSPNIYHCGDVMYDNSLYFSKISAKKSSVIFNLNLENANFVLATIHRNNNTDSEERLSAIFQALLSISEQNKIKIVLPLHPRTLKMMHEILSKKLLDLISSSIWIKIIEPVGFLDMIELEKNANIIITDSGGVQKEAFFFQKPCVILRPETEWVEIVENGNAILTDADELKIIEAYFSLSNNNSYTYPPFYGDGNAANFIINKILSDL